MKKNEGMGLLSEKTKALHAELDERAEAAISSYSAEVDFAYNICIRCLWLRIIRRSMNFPSQIFFNDINHGYRAAILKKSSLWLLLFLWLCLIIATIKRTMPRLQLYRTSLNTICNLQQLLINTFERFALCAFSL